LLSKPVSEPILPVREESIDFLQIFNPFLLHVYNILYKFKYESKPKIGSFKNEIRDPVIISNPMGKMYEKKLETLSK